MSAQRSLALACAAALLTSPVFAATTPRSKPVEAPAPRIHALEQALEVSSRNLRLPDTPSGFMLVTACPSCTTVSLAVDAQSKFLLNHKELPLAELRAKLTPSVLFSATVIYSSADKRLTRLLVTSR
jgi:hypothetical protein